MPKVEIDVDQILTSAVSLEVEPGDRMLVMNGVVIGMIERRTRPAAAEPPELPAPAGTKRKTSSQDRKVISASDRETEKKVVEQLRVKDLTASQIAKRIGDGERLILRDLMMSMRRRNVITPVNPTARFPAYRLNRDAAPQH